MQTQSATDFAKLLSESKFHQAYLMFDKKMAAALPEAQLHATWAQLEASYGRLKSLGSPQKANIPPYEVNIIPAQFERQTLDLKIAVDAGGKVAGFFIVPHTPPETRSYRRAPYVEASKFNEIPTKVSAGDIALDALWTMPTTDGPVPAVILVHGSGPHDKDETIGPNKPFKDLAEGLASYGIAVLRYEKRTKQYPKKMDLAKTTVKQETVDDAVAAFELAGKTDGIDPTRVFILGHSLGGYVMPRIAARTPGAHGYIILGGNTRPLEDLLVEQTSYLSQKSPHSTQQLQALKQQVALVKSEKLTPDTPVSQLPLGVPAAYWLDLKGYDPIALAAGIEKPMLVLQGGRDYQVTVQGDFSRWQELAKSKKSITTRLYQNANHLFSEGVGMATPSEYLTEHKPVSATVVRDIANWIQTQYAARDTK
jgi:uncharacterized protein